MTQTYFWHLEQIFGSHSATFLAKTLYLFENLFWTQGFWALKDEDFIIFSFSNKLYREVILITVIVDMNLTSLSRIFRLKSGNLFVVEYHICFAEWILEFHVFQKVSIWNDTTWSKICFEFRCSFIGELFRDFLVDSVDSLISKSCSCVVAGLAEHFYIKRTAIVVVSYFKCIFILCFYANGLFNYIMDQLLPS
jgi:hypothetical protein